MSASAVKQRHAALGPAQSLHELGALAGRLGRVLGEQRFERGIGPLREHAPQHRGLAQQQLAQIRAVAENAREQAVQVEVMTDF